MQLPQPGYYPAERAAPGTKKHFRIISQGQLAGVGGNPGVPLALNGEDGAPFNATPESEPIKPGRDGTDHTAISPISMIFKPVLLPTAPASGGVW